VETAAYRPLSVDESRFRAPPASGPAESEPDVRPASRFGFRAIGEGACARAFERLRGRVWPPYRLYRHAI